MKTLREKINSNEKIAGALVSLTDPCLCEIMGNIGYDCVWIDTEHTYMSYKEVLCHLNAARSSNIPAIVRLPQNDLTATKKILEMGPDGVIFPMAKSAGEIKDLIEMTLYPPTELEVLDHFVQLVTANLTPKSTHRKKALKCADLYR